MVFSFPNPVNEVAARVVAGGVALLGLAILLTQWWWLSAVLLYGFVARVAAGPRFSPLGLLATKVIVPRLPAAPRMVPGPPKRFAQAIGVLFSGTAALLGLVLGQPMAASLVLAVLVVFALLESVAGFCAGCAVFGVLMRAGVIPREVCESCGDIWAGRETPAA